MCTRVSIATTISELSRRMAKRIARHPRVRTSLLALVFGMSALRSPMARASPQREWLGARPVERPLVLPRGWSEAAVAWDHDRVDGGFGDNGRRQEWVRPMRMDAVTTSLRLGLASRVEAFASIETVRLATDDQRRVGVGPARIGARVELLASKLPLSSLAAELVFQPPIGTNIPSTTQLSAPAGTDLAVGTRASEFLPAIRFRQQLGPLRFETGLVASMSLSTGANASDERTNWGNGVGLDGSGLVQVGPVAIATRVSAVRWGDDLLNGVRVPSAGWHVSICGGGIMSVNRSVDFVLTWQHTLRGRPTQFAGAPHLSPTHGPGHHLSVVYRW